MNNSLQPGFNNLSDIVKALENQHKVSTTITNNATVAMFMMNDKGFCTFMNPAAEQMIGFKLEEVQDQPLHYIIHHHHPDGTPFPMEECPIDKALPTNNSVRAHQDTFIRRDGTFFPVSCAASPIFEDGVPVATVIEVKDLTEEKRAEKALRDSEEMFRFMAETLPQMFWITRPDGYCTYYNQRWVEFTGIPMEQLLGFGWLETLHPDDKEKASLAWRTAVETSGDYQVEYRVRRHDGKYRWHLTRGLPRVDENGVISMWVGSTTDIHEHKSLAQELLSANEEMAAAFEREQAAYQKVESQRQMLHDLFMQAPAMIAIQRGPEHVYELVNPHYQRLAPGRTFVGKTVEETWPELKSQGFFDLLDQVYKTGEPYYGKELLAKIDRFNTGNLEDTYYNFVYQAFKEEGKIAGIVTFAFDVTELVLAKQSSDINKNNSAE
ncbi:PAS domain-containing protein [Adhaeribacter aquaticus]|uniref:PAS domain-containing protein n=1 Tax=Adhaeribacter aquaticus TaxID=299567 RepID=UPI0004256329|nr:PAS domain-containing protein [Adhaeribacter aquaticus]